MHQVCQHHSSATVSPGPLKASFPLHFRVSGAQPAEGRRFQGSVVDVRVVSETVQEFDYRIKIGLTFLGDYAVYQSFFKNPFHEASPLDVRRHLKEFTDRTSDHFHHLRRVPHVRYEELDDTEGQFVASLPPYTSMYTDSVGFWDTLGFQGSAESGYSVLDKKMRDVAGVVWGFENQGRATMVEYISRKMASGTEPMDILYENYAGNLAVNRPKLEVRVMEDVLPIALSKKRALSRHQVVEGLSLIIDEGLALLNLDENFISVVASGRYLLVKSKELGDDPKMKVVIEVSPKLADFLQMEGPSMEFPLHDSKSYQLEPKDDSGYDPLEDFYPVYLIPEGSGSGNDYVEGRGFTTVLSTMRGPGDFVGSGSVFYGEVDELRLTFLDRSFKPIVTRETLKVFLGLELRPLF